MTSYGKGGTTPLSGVRLWTWACGVLVSWYLAILVSSYLPRDIVLVVDVSGWILVTSYTATSTPQLCYAMVPHAVTLPLLFATRRTCLPPYPQNDLYWRAIRIFPGSPYP